MDQKLCGKKMIALEHYHFPFKYKLEGHLIARFENEYSGAIYNLLEIPSEYYFYVIN